MRVIYLCFSIFLLFCISCKSKHEIHILSDVSSPLDTTTDTKIRQEIGYKNSKINELPKYFFDHLWVHHFENDMDGLQHFKPSDFKSRPSRYRNQLSFKQDGTCQYRWLAPNDAHEMRDATWAYLNNKIYILENKVDIISLYEIADLSDSLLLLKEISDPINMIYGRWKLVMVEDQDYSSQGYTIDIKGSNIVITNKKGNSDTFEMSHSPWRLQEPMALHFDPKISNTYPWLGSGHYGLINDTLFIEIDANKNSKFIR